MVGSSGRRGARLATARSVAVPPGDLSSAITPVSITPATAVQRCLKSCPAGINFAAAFNLDIGDSRRERPGPARDPGVAGHSRWAARSTSTARASSSTPTAPPAHLVAGRVRHGRRRPHGAHAFAAAARRRQQRPLPGRLQRERAGRLQSGAGQQPDQRGGRPRLAANVSVNGGSGGLTGVQAPWSATAFTPPWRCPPIGGADARRGLDPRPRSRRRLSRATTSSSCPAS